MSTTVCLAANTIRYLEGGGHSWVYLNWALGLRAAGCRVIWLESMRRGAPPRQVRSDVAALRRRLAPHGLSDSVALLVGGERPPEGEPEGGLPLEEVFEADLLLNFAYALRPSVVGRFRRSALVDIDPGLNQVWLSEARMRVAPHDVYFTIGETVGRPEARFPDGGRTWHYTPPPVHLPAWPPIDVTNGASYTTITHWWGALMEYRSERYYNGKRDGFLPYFDLPAYVQPQLELAIGRGACIGDERAALERRGWRIEDAHSVAGTPGDYQRYIRGSRAEFSCAKPSCLHLQNAWISDRTLCYLASGKPAVVEHTGDSRFLPDAEGLCRFRNLQEAVRAIESVESDYEWHSRRARALAEEHFDARKVARSVLERALD